MMIDLRVNVGILVLAFGMVSCEAFLEGNTNENRASPIVVNVEEEIVTDSHRPIDFDQLIQRYENKSREEWQRPEEVIDYLEPLSGKKVADIGAGSGYFSYRLLYRDAQVVATEIDERFVKWLEDHVLELDSTFHDKFETRQVEPGQIGLMEEEVDAILMVNTFSFILYPIEYLQQIKKSLKPGGVVVLVDYKTQRVPVPAPKLEDRLILGEMEGLLLDAGFEKLIVEDCLLDFQWLIRAQKPMTSM